MTITPLPQLPAEEVARWKEAGGRTIDLLRKAHETGPLVAVPLGEHPTVLVTAPADVQYVLGRNADRYVKSSHHRAAVLVGDGLLAATGDRWKRQRRLLQPHFTLQATRRYEQLMRAAADHTAGRWAESARTGELRDIGEDMRRFSLDVIWRCMTGDPLDDATQRQWEATDRIGKAIAALGESSIPDLEADLAEVDAVAARAVAVAASNDAPSLLDALAGQSPKAVRDEVVTFLAAGYETTATTLQWLLLLLHEHPEEREFALAQGLAGSPERTEAVRDLIRETLRLYPAAWLMPRHALEDDDVAGHRVEKGSTVLICPYLTHRDPEVWPDPESFRPRRFLGPTPTPGSYHPFGLGPRACLGAQFSLHEMVILLELLLPAYEFTVTTPRPEPLFGLTVHPGGPTRATLTLVRG